MRELVPLLVMLVGVTIADAVLIGWATYAYAAYRKVTPLLAVGVMNVLSLSFPFAGARGGWAAWVWLVALCGGVYVVFLVSFAEWARAEARRNGQGQP